MAEALKVSLQEAEAKKKKDEEEKKPEDNNKPGDVQMT